MKAREWLEQGATTDNPFDALTNYWRGFNNLFAGEGQERELIAYFLRAWADEPFAKCVLDTEADNAEILLSEPVVDMRMNGKDTSTYIQQFETAETSVDKLVALFMVIYQVRCNSVHGQKSPFRERDRVLCKASCPFVAAVVNHAV